MPDAGESRVTGEVIEVVVSSRGIFRQSDRVSTKHKPSPLNRISLVEASQDGALGVSVKTHDGYRGRDDEA